MVLLRYCAPRASKNAPTDTGESPYVEYFGLSQNNWRKKTSNCIDLLFESYVLLSETVFNVIPFTNNLNWTFIWGQHLSLAAGGIHLRQLISTCGSGVLLTDCFLCCFCFFFANCVPRILGSSPKEIKIRICCTQNVGKVWISRHKHILALFYEI